MFLNRREWWMTTGAGFAALPLHFLLQQDCAAETPSTLAAKAAHFAPKAKAVIFLFMFGGPSSMDTFDPKPALAKYHGKPLPGFDGKDNFFIDSKSTVLQSPFRFAQYGQSGQWVSDRFPHLAQCVDDICFLRSVKAENNNHRPAILQMNTGSLNAGRPSMGSWVTYGLGSENTNLPPYVVMLDRAGGPFGGALNWSTGYMPASYQGTPFRSSGEPIADLSPASGVTTEQQRARLDLLARMNERHLQQNPGEGALAARLSSYELAYRMQTAAPEIVDLSRETDKTRRRYGLGDAITEPFGRQCLLARRLVERGVRFVQLYSGGGDAMGTNGWDAHSDLDKNHATLCQRVDQPIAGLLNDLKSRGMLDETLVIWGGEFGRLPTAQGGKGRDHNPHGFTMWLAGGGVKGGISYGATDEFGYKAAEDPITVPDLHATCLHLMGLDHKRLTYRFQGRDFRLTDVSGEVIHSIMT